nr:M15 family metallopeptidase [Bacillus massiliglaciei]
MVKNFFKTIMFLAFLAAFFYWIWSQFLRPVELKEIELPNGLNPIVSEKKDELIKKAKDKGIQVIITDGYRSREEQTKIYNKGREAPGEIVTYAKAGESLHNFGLAIDFALLNKEGNPIWDTDYDGNNNGRADWDEVVEIAKGLGFEWGGDWVRFKDYPHLQMDFGLSLRELQRGKQPPESNRE